ncbi:MAG: phosphomannose isomerase type II C-terminal cupin domain [Candidatus Woesearchaeota archaeon]|nr:MAG: phosphomannose isomerase type II C-terminal cupin domain [Candidatus Woesearchaeota archaeon]
MEKYSEKRPWGNFEQFCKNEKCTVKMITVNPNEKLSLQYHNDRDEFWRVVLGSGVVVIRDEEIKCKENDEFFIQKGTNHRIITKDSMMKLLEISFGDFDEKDIIRLEDKYNRK